MAFFVRRLDKAYNKFFSKFHNGWDLFGVHIGVYSGFWTRRPLRAPPDQLLHSY
jgi:hypothetical protein